MKRIAQISSQAANPTIDRSRCDWGNRSSELMRTYHDKEWGVPVHDDRKQFEFLTLEAAQAGLSWYVVLSKRENYRRAFADFDPERVARFSSAKVERLLQNQGIIRNRAKINATIHNARLFLDVRDEFGSFDEFIWKFVDGKTIQNSWKSMRDLPQRSKESDALSKELKSRGFKFMGSVVCYSHMQAVGMVNDHLVSCFRFEECQKLAKLPRISRQS